MMIQNRLFSIARYTLALSALAGAGVISAHAQQSAVASGTMGPKLNFQVPAVAPEATFSSSSDVNADVVAENHFDFVEAAKEPPSRTYGRPRYRGGNTNADGSNKYAFIAGVGLTIPTSDLRNNLTTSWGLQVGAGRNFNKTFGLMAQFDYDNFGFTGKTLANQLTIYNSPVVFNGQLPQLDGNSHIWSFTLNPVINIPTNGSMGAYVVGGVGFYHKTANFTVPVEEEDIFGDVFDANQTIDKYTSNAPGFSGGFGLTYKTSRFSNERLYAEVRYVYVDSSVRSGITIANYNTGALTATSTNLYPANSNHSMYIPVKFGIRF
jgi:hypothetical protein